MRSDYLRWGVFGGLFATLLVPFIIADGGAGYADNVRSDLYLPFINLFFPYITGKNFIFRILVELTLGLYVLLALREPSYRPRMSHLFWALGGLVVWMGVATLGSIDPIKSFWSNFERMEGYVGLLHLFAYFCMAGAALSAARLWERFFTVSVAASAVMALIGIFQMFSLFGFMPSSQSGARADGTFGNATYLAVYLLFNVFITLYLFARLREALPPRAWFKDYRSWLCGTALLLQCVSLWGTQTRGALLGLIGGLVVGGLYLALRIPSVRRWVVGALCATAVLAGAFVALKDAPLVKSSATLSRLASISLEEATVKSRLLHIWPMALQGGLERPLTGWGQENFSYVFNAHYDPAMYAQEPWFDRAHNQFLDYLVAGGVPAALLYLALFMLAAWAVVRSSLALPAQAALLGLLSAYAFNNLFVFDNLVSALYFFFILAFVHSLSKRDLPGSLALSRPLGERVVLGIAPAVLAASLFLAWGVNAPALSRASGIVDALQTVQRGADGSVVQKNPSENLAAFERLLDDLPWPGSALGYQESVEQLLQKATTMASSELEPALKEEFFTLARRHAEHVLAARQGDARLELFYAVFLAQAGDRTKALEHLLSAREHSPKKQQIYFQLGNLYLQGGNASQALEALRQAYELEPAYDQARILYATGLTVVGQQAAADALLVERWGSLAADNEELLRYFENTGQVARAVVILRLRVEQNPQSPEPHLRLANLYFAAGDTAATIAQLEEAAALDPARAAQIQALINQVRAGARSQ